MTGLLLPPIRGCFVSGRVPGPPSPLAHPFFSHRRGAVGEFGAWGAGSGVFRRLRRRASFWMPRKKPKRHRGEPQVELRPFGLVLHAVSPLDPLFYGGRQLGSSCGFPKGAGGVGIDIASPAAAWVGFPVRRFPRLRARLWHGGAQVARWDGVGGDLHHPEALAAW